MQLYLSCTKTRNNDTDIETSKTTRIVLPYCIRWKILLSWTIDLQSGFAKSILGHHWSSHAYPKFFQWVIGKKFFEERCRAWTWKQRVVHIYTRQESFNHVIPERHADPLNDRMLDRCERHLWFFAKPQVYNRFNTEYRSNHYDKPPLSSYFLRVRKEQCRKNQYEEGLVIVKLRSVWRRKFGNQSRQR